MNIPTKWIKPSNVVLMVLFGGSCMLLVIDLQINRGGGTVRLVRRIMDQERTTQNLLKEENVQQSNISRVLIVAYVRTGSSFVGALFQSKSPQTFYWFEPLYYLKNELNIWDTENFTKSSSNLISSILSCNFSKIQSFVEWFSRKWILLRRNTWLWNQCQHENRTICGDATQIEKICHRSDHHTMKVVRMRMKQLESLWQTVIEPLNVKVIFLVRDPRGMYNSRKTIGWCNNRKACIDIGSICQQMRQDLHDFDRIKQQNSQHDNLVLLRYEDLANDPMVESRKLFSKLNLEYTEGVEQFIRTHTSGEVDNQNPYSTYRQSNRTATRWKNELSHGEQEMIENECRDVLQRLQYI